MSYLNELSIDKYRGIQNLRIKDLKAVNLIVGDNNCGKTSVLEAIQLLRTSGNLANVYSIARQRTSLSTFNGNSIFDNFICMFPHNNNEELEIAVSGKFNDSEINYRLIGKKNRILLDPKELDPNKYKVALIPDSEVETESFEGDIFLKYDSVNKQNHIDINQYSNVTGTYSAGNDIFNIVYVSPYDHLRGSIINRILRNETYKQICIKALQLFDPDIEDMMIYRSDVGNRPVEYIRHKKLGDMPVATFGDGLKKVLSISNAIAQSVGGILLFDEVETSIHKKYYNDIFLFIIKACKSFNVQLFITTHSIEAIDGILATQNYDSQQEEDNLSVCTIKRSYEKTFSRVMTGREVYENREAFGFEVRL